MAHHAGRVRATTITTTTTTHHEAGAGAAESAMSQPPHVTLHSPRPDTERSANHYVDTPFRPPPLQDRPPVRLPAPGTARRTTTHHHNTTTTHHSSSTGAATAAAAAAVTKQPIAFTKEQPAAVTQSSGVPPLSSIALGRDCNIICSECGRCRCDSCRTPRPLPSRWLCDNACLCSADAIIDYASCLCCVKGLYYHCSDTDTGVGATCADDPCSCGPPRVVARWSCLAALAAVLPCLLCYWPLRGCQRAVEAAYARHSRAGCRCNPVAQHATPEKRLLDASPDF